RRPDGPASSALPGLAPRSPQPGTGAHGDADGLSAAAAHIDQAQVDEVTRAWLARQESVLDGIDVI
ncbi:hypothetical protein, partial [Frankia sp. R82]|uniref:hypothetical protein n=1 Tax=Frankia sp. R82 TaxID=2950553 RepID=UPI002043A36A